MVQRLRRPGIAIACGLLMAAAPAPGFRELKGPWRIDYGENNCTLSRDTEGPTAMSIGIRAGAKSFVPDLVIVQPETSSHKARLVNGHIRIGDRPEHAAEITDLSTPAEHVRILPIPLTMAGLSTIGDTTVTVSDDHSPLLSFHLTDFAKAAAALEACRASLAKSLGIDVDALRSTAITPAEPIASPLTWVLPSDYFKNPELPAGWTELLWTIGPAARVKDCRVTSSSGNPDVDAVPCALLRQRARYRPALDAQGHAVESYDMRRFSFSSRSPR